MNLSKETQESIQKLQMYESQLQTFGMQRQQFQAQLFEVDSALKELQTAKTSYKIIGNIMVAASPEQLKKDLTQKKELVELRLENISKQEEKMRGEATKLQEELMKQIKE